jgi:hypothetical protein
MNVEITKTAPAAPCIATGGDRIFFRACRECPSFALGCFPARSAGSTAPDPEEADIATADDVKAMQRHCANSPCLATGAGRVFTVVCRDCPAFAVWCFPARPAVA